MSIMDCATGNLIDIGGLCSWLLMNPVSLTIPQNNNHVWQASSQTQDSHLFKFREQWSND